MGIGNKSAPKIWRAGTLTYTSIGLVFLLLWLLWGDLAWQMKERAVIGVAQVMVKSYGVSDLIYTLLVISLPNFTNIFLMPIVSYRSDRHRSKWGRRVPYLMMNTPIVMIGLIGLGFTNQIGELLHSGILPGLDLNLCKFISFAFFWILLDLGTTLTNAIFMALSNDVVPPELIGRFVSIFRGASLMCAVIFNYFLFGYALEHVLIVFVGLAIFYGIGLFSMCLMVKEGEYPPVPVCEERAGGPISALFSYFKVCFKMPYYRWVIAAQTISALSVLPINCFVVIHAKQMGMDMGYFGKVGACVPLFAMLTSYPLGILADKFHPIRTGMLSMGALSIVLAVGGFLIHGETSFLVVYLIHGVLIMTFNTLTTSYGQRLFPRILYAQFNSALELCRALSTVVLSVLTGWFFDYTGVDYRYMYTIGAVFGISGTLMYIKVYSYYKLYGGDQNYQAPLLGTETEKARA